MKRKVNVKFCLAPSLALICLGVAWIGFAQEGLSGAGFLNSLSGQGSSVSKRHGAAQAGRSRGISEKTEDDIDTTRKKRIPRQPAPPRLTYSPVSLHVVNRSRNPVASVSLSLSIADYHGKVIHVQRNTNTAGELNLSKVGPLPADIKVYSADKTKWKLANAQSARFVIDKNRRVRYAFADQTAGDSTNPVRIASLRWPAGLTLVSTSPSAIGYVMVKPTKVHTTIKATPGATVSSPALPEVKPVGFTPQGRPVIDPNTLPQIPVSDSGEVETDIPSSSLEDGAVPIVVSKDMPGGNVEAVINSYNTDSPDASISSPPLRLASLKMVKLGDESAKSAQDYPDLTDVTNRSNSQVLGIDRKDYLGVLSTEDQIKEHQRELGKQHKEKMDDGSQWWIYDKAGIGFKMREMVRIDNIDKTDNAAERVRIFGANGGTIGGISVGDTRDDVISKIGDPQVTNDPRYDPSDKLNAKGSIDTYLDNGLRICYVDNKVSWMDVTRPDKLLLRGTTAFVPRGPARLYVGSFRGNNNMHCNIRTLSDFKHFLGQLPSVQLVDSEDEADLRIDAAITSFTEDKKKLIGIIPTKYECTTALTYSLYDENVGKYIAKDKVLTGSADVSVSKVTYLGIGAAIFAYRQNPAIGLGILIATAVNAVNKIKKAATICPPASIRQAFNNLTQDVSQAVDFSAHVTSIDYNRGLLTLNMGSDAGVHPSTPDQPFEFRVSVAGTPLGDSNDKDGRHADYYDAVVRSVTPDSCVCEFQHVEGLIQGENGTIPSNPDKKTLGTLPDPSTGLISAQATVNFPPVTVFSDNDIEQMKSEIVHWGDGVKNNPQQAQQTQ